MLVTLRNVSQPPDLRLRRRVMRLRKRVGRICACVSASGVEIGIVEEIFSKVKPAGFELSASRVKVKRLNPLSHTVRS